MEAKMKTKAHVPMRKCVGCGKSLPQNNLVRIVLNENGLSVDVTRRANGRGTYLSKNEDVIRQAFKKKAFNRIFRREFQREELADLERELIELIKTEDDSEVDK